MLILIDFLVTGSKAILCVFHREKAWEEWTKKNDHGIQDKSTALTLLRNIANSENQTDYIKSLEELNKSDLYRKNDQFQNYFTKTWFPEREVA